MSRLTTKQRRARARRRWDWPVPFSVRDESTGKALRPVQRRPRRRDEFAARGAVLTFDPRGKPLHVTVSYALYRDLALDYRPHPPSPVLDALYGG